MALPDSWVDHLFAKLAVRFGDAWTRKWEGIQMTAVRADWAAVLDGMPGPALQHGLNNLPREFPPTAHQFRDLCIRRADDDRATVPALPAPSSVNVGQAQRLREIVAGAFATPKDPRRWAHSLKARHEAGERLSQAQIDAYTAALRALPEEVAA